MAVNKCNSPNCKTCKPLLCNNNFTSSVTNNRYLLDHTGVFTCKSRNIVYLITCSACSIQYVGLTEQRLHERINGHRASVRAGKNLYIYQHFNTEGHAFEDATIQIIDYVDEKSSNVKHDLQKLESLWINTLCTAYPLGLNDNIRDVGNISKSSVIDIYFKSPTKRYKTGHGRRRSKRRIILTEEDIEKEIVELKRNLNTNKNLFYRKLKCYQKRQIFQLYQICASGVGFLYNVMKSYIHLIFPPKIKPDKPNLDYIIFTYTSKCII